MLLCVTLCPLIICPKAVEILAVEGLKTCHVLNFKPLNQAVNTVLIISADSIVLIISAYSIVMYKGMSKEENDT